MGLLKSSATLRFASLAGFLGVSLGAFGAHGLKAILESHGTVAIWEKAVLYHLVHTVALLALGLSSVAASRWIARLWLAGIVIFSGSLYLLAVTGVRWLGAITPLGGLCFLAGWAWLAATERGGRDSQNPS